MNDTLPVEGVDDVLEETLPDRRDRHEAHRQLMQEQHERKMRAREDHRKGYHKINVTANVLL